MFISKPPSIVVHLQFSSFQFFRFRASELPFVIHFLFILLSFTQSKKVKEKKKQQIQKQSQTLFRLILKFLRINPKRLHRTISHMERYRGGVYTIHKVLTWRIYTFPSKEEKKNASFMCHRDVVARCRRSIGQSETVLTCCTCYIYIYIYPYVCMAVSLYCT